MKRLMFCFMIALGCLMAAAAGASDTAPENGPNAVAPEPSFQFKPVLEGEEVVHDFIVRNTGTEPLVIEKVKTG